MVFLHKLMLCEMDNGIATILIGFFFLHVLYFKSLLKLFKHNTNSVLRKQFISA